MIIKLNIIKKDNHIDKCDEYLKYYSNKFNEYDKKKKMNLSMDLCQILNLIIHQIR